MLIYQQNIRLPFSLPAGSIFERSVSLTSNNSDEIFLRTNVNPKVTSIYNFQNDSFALIDSLNEKIVKDAGDFNNNGLADLLNYFVRDGFIDEQTSAKLLNIYSKIFKHRW